MGKADRRKKHEERRVARDARPDRCGYYLEKKRRYCSMQRKKGNDYCSEHMVHTSGQRIPCPLDPSHTVWESEVEVHVKKCNAGKQERDRWYSLDYNTENKTQDNTPQTTNSTESQVKIGEKRKSESEESSPKRQATELSSSDTSLILKYLPVVNAFNLEPLAQRYSAHPAMDPLLKEVQNQKHIIQQSALVGHLRDTGLLGESFYMEYGCGKGELSRCVNYAVINEKETKAEDTPSNFYGFGFVDRGVNRMKVDSKIIRDCEAVGLTPIVRRSRIDIKDLVLDDFLDIEGQKPEKIVVISKHLCGAATDLTLRSLINSSVPKGSLSGVLIAMCCRHVCQYEHLLPESRDYLASHGIDKEGLLALRKMVSWAVSGSGREKSTEKNEQSSENQDTIHNDSSSSTNPFGTFEERVQLGLKARRLIDESRRHAMVKLLPGYEVDMFSYTDYATTPENVALFIRRE